MLRFAYHLAIVPSLNRKQITRVMQLLSKDHPHPKTELEFSNTYQLLVAVVMSAQATDVGVNKATRKLFGKVTTPQQMVGLGVEKLQEHIKSVGLFRTKAKNVIALSEQLIAMHDSNVPHDRAALENLPGVGRKTANVVLNCAFGEPTMAVDTHVFRVSCRTGLGRGKNVREMEDSLVKSIPGKYMLNAHHWLILHGRYVCTARSPKCASCKIRRICLFQDKTLP